MIAKYKITLLGDGMVGKTSLCSRYLQKSFAGEYMATMGADISLKTITVREQQIQLQIWDIAGQPFFEAVRKTYFQGAIGALFVFDVTRPETSQNGSNWIRELWKHNGKGEIPIVILGNKIDLREPSVTTVDFEAGQTLAEEFSNPSQSDSLQVPYLETSAKTGESVERAFILLAEEIIAYIARQLRQ
ncbi:MAG: Rab family GTPase [Candidatus Heimdallarchaeota archaeon]